MLINHFLENQKKRLQKNSDFYTSRGIHVYFKDKIANEIDVESVMAKIESKLPAHMLSEIEMIVIGWFDEFEEREVNAFYDSGAVYVSNIQSSDEDLFDDIVHEISHSVEEAYGYQIYGDQKIKDEFLRKREYLHDIKKWDMISFQQLCKECLSLHTPQRLLENILQQCSQNFIYLLSITFSRK